MANEKFPEVQPGQPITAARANREGAVLERVAGMAPGTGMSGYHGGTVVQFGTTTDAKLATLKVVDVSTAPVYRVVLRQYNFQTAAWEDGLKQWYLDAAAGGGAYGLDDLVAGYFDRKRGAFIPFSSGGLFPVLVAKDGGIAGGSGVDCTFTYTVKDFAGAVLDTTVTPERPRYGNCAYLAGGEGGRTTYGLAIYDSGTLKLLVAFGEIEDTTACDEEESSSSSSSVTSSSSTSSMTSSSESSPSSTSSSESSGSSTSSTSSVSSTSPSSTSPSSTSEGYSSGSSMSNSSSSMTSSTSSYSSMTSSTSSQTSSASSTSSTSSTSSMTSSSTSSSSTSSTSSTSSYSSHSSSSTSSITSSSTSSSTSSMTSSSTSSLTSSSTSTSSTSSLTSSSTSTSSTSSSGYEVLCVTGTLTPDSTGTYAEAGTYNGEAYYEIAGGGWYIWFDTVDGYWIISSELGNSGEGSYSWAKEAGGATPVGSYVPWHDTIGMATVDWC